MQILALSDLHGYLPDLPQAEIVLIAGDITPPFLSLQEEKSWILHDFTDWLFSIQAKEIILVAGNKDRAFAGGREITNALPVVYLEDELHLSRGISFWGTPWSLARKDDWSFALDEAGLREAFAPIPKNLDILISHSPPRGVLDSSSRKKDLGSLALLNKIQEAAPRILLCGHMHDRGLEQARVGQTTVLNAALLDLRIASKSRNAGWMIFWDQGRYSCEITRF